MQEYLCAATALFVLGAARVLGTVNPIPTNTLSVVYVLLISQRDVAHLEDFMGKIRNFVAAGAISAAVIGAAFPIGTAGATVIYDDNFHDGVGIGPHASPSSFDVNFSSGSGSAAISFQLFGGKSLDGFGNCCTDIFTVSLDGTDVFSGSFSMGGGGSNTELLNTYGWTWLSMAFGGLFDGGFTDITGSITGLLAGSHTLTFKYDGASQGTGDESWAINSLDVAMASAIPVPAALPLLATALGALGFAGWRRSSKSA